MATLRKRVCNVHHVIVIVAAKGFKGFPFGDKVNDGRVVKIVVYIAEVIEFAAVFNNGTAAVV